MIGNETIRYFIKIVRSELALSNKEKEILIARLEKKTLNKIGRKYHLTAERIRQIEDGAVKKFLKKVNQLFLFE
jgi:DNA-directed RNA polymerase sigma subunit (sigma70/sigma32)